MVRVVHRTLKGWARRWLPLLLAPPALVAMLFNAWQFTELWIDHDRAYEDTQQQVEVASREISRLMLSVLRPVDIHLTDHLRPVATRLVQGQASQLQLQRAFQLTMDRLPQAAAVVVFDASGRPVAGSVPLRSPAPDVSGGFFFQRHRDLGVESAVFVGDSSRSLASAAGDDNRARWRLVMTRRLQDLDGRFLGVVHVHLDSEYLFAQLTDLNLPSGTTVRLLDAAGTLLISHPRDHSLIGRNFWDGKLLRRWAAERRDIAGRIPDPTDDSPEIGALRSVDGYPVLISVGVSEDLALVEWWRELALLLLTIVVFMGASALAARKPLAKWVLHLNGKGVEEKGFADGDGI